MVERGESRSVWKERVLKVVGLGGFIGGLVYLVHGVAAGALGGLALAAGAQYLRNKK